jgi:hypothetical protein
MIISKSEFVETRRFLLHSRISRLSPEIIPRDSAGSRFRARARAFSAPVRGERNSAMQARCSSSVFARASVPWLRYDQTNHIADSRCLSPRRDAFTRLHVQKLSRRNSRRKEIIEMSAAARLYCAASASPHHPAHYLLLRLFYYDSKILLLRARRR